MFCIEGYLKPMFEESQCETWAPREENLVF